MTAPNRVPVAVYICTGESDAAELLAEYCERYATAREWVVSAVHHDIDRRQRLAERPGWTQVADLLVRGAARGIVTLTRGMVAEDDAGYDAVRLLVRSGGGFLAAVRAEAVRPLHRSAPDLARRHAIADVAAGWVGP